MRYLLIISALLLAPTQAAAVDWYVGVTFDNGRIVAGNNGIRGRIGQVPWARERSRRRHDGHRGRYRDKRPLYIIYPSSRSNVTESPDPAVEPAKTEARAIVEPTPAAAPPAPDPKGAASRHRARGAIGQRNWTVGDYLPSGVPHVKLAANVYDLPTEPDGKIYARVRRDVLLIDAVTRRIEAIITE